MFSLCLSVCLFICLTVCLQDYAKSYGWMYVKFSGREWPRANPINFGGHPEPNRMMLYSIFWCFWSSVKSDLSQIFDYIMYVIDNCSMADIVHNESSAMWILHRSVSVLSALHSEHFCINFKVYNPLKHGTVDISGSGWLYQSIHPFLMPRTLSRLCYRVLRVEVQVQLL